MVCTKDEQDLAKLHTKGETIASIQEGNKEFRASFGLAVGGMLEELGTWRSGQVEGCRQLGERQPLLLRLGEVVEQVALELE